MAQNSGVAASAVVVGPASAVSGNVATYSGITGKLVADGGTALSALATSAVVTSGFALKLSLTGGTMSGAIAMGANNITGTGANSGGSFAASLTTASTTTGTGAIVSASGLGVAGAVNIGGITKVNDTTPSLTSTSGALVVSGGIGCGKDLNIGSSGNLILAGGNISVTGKVTASNTSCFWGYANGGFVVTYVASTAKLVDTATLTEIYDPSSEFTPTASTGRVQYTGTTTRPFYVRIIFNVFGSASAQTIELGYQKMEA